MLHPIAVIPILFLCFVLSRRRPSKLISNHTRFASGKEEYDYIIVGGGTAGCVLASRLSEDPTNRVLVLEAGVSGKEQLLSRIPSGFSTLFFSKHAYQMYTEPQEHACGKKKFIPRAKMLGGCSSMNGSILHFCSPGDFDEWAETVQDSSWSWSNFSKYFHKVENFAPPDEEDVHGREGLASAGYFSAFSEYTNRFVQACVAVGIKTTRDFNGLKGSLGVGRFVTFIDKNLQRVSSESAYLTPSVLERKNLDVVIQATVTRVLFDGKRAIGVEFAKHEKGPKYRVVASKEVILSAGAIHSPHILLLSGVGPAEDLQKYDIPVVQNVAVGQNLMDHALVDLYFRDKTEESVGFLLLKHPFDYLRLVYALFQFLAFGTGTLSSNFGEAAAFVRSDDPALFPESKAKFKDVSSGKTSPDLELFLTPIAYKDHGLVGFDFHSISMHATLLRPSSRGYVSLKSSSPWDHPRIDPNFLQASEDVDRLVQGVKLLLRIARAEPLNSAIHAEDEDANFDHRLHLQSDDDLRNLVRSRVEHLYHPTSTCRMGPESEGSVVDSQLRVHGIQGLRVCDASIFPAIPSGHPVLACFASAEKLADEILRREG